jgi:uncharacterized cupredoxin-like copper-binding protein
MRSFLVACYTLATALSIACSSSGEGGREILITQTDEGCTPETVEVAPGEKLKLSGKNETGGIYELEGTNGTQLEEIIVPEGRTRSVGYTVPSEAGTYDVKCYQPGGVSTIVKLVAGGGAEGDTTNDASGDGLRTPGGNDDPADTTVQVDLTEYAVDASQTSVPAGNIEFVAENLSADEVHELAVLKVNEDGEFDVMGEIEDIPAGEGGAIRLRLETGRYELACLIVPGEAGSTADHYQQGMRIAFTVE